MVHFKCSSCAATVLATTLWRVMQHCCLLLQGLMGEAVLRFVLVIVLSAPTLVSCVALPVKLLLEAGCG